MPSATERRPQAPAFAQLRRRRTGRLVAGVAGGVAEHLDLPVLWVRGAFAVLAGCGGAGILAYALLWVFVPQGTTAERPISVRERQQGLGLILLGIGAMVAVGSLIALPTWVVALLVVELVGAAVVWREADESQRRRWRQGARSGVADALFGGGGRSALVRILAGASLVVVGIVVFLVGTSSIDDVRFGLLAVAATLIGVAVLTVPWWVRLVRDLNVERASRIRSQERAEIAAHLHDSVLQTLALIQKQADSEREVRRLARGQERELRNWLYGPDGYGSDRRAPVEDAPATAFAAELGRICGEVEDVFAVKIQQVVVGDCDLDERLTAQLAAAREAVVNAAKHAGVAEVSVYAEVESAQVSVYVRDRGAGFDPDNVPEDRHGLADSIRGRMQRHGGRVKVRTSPGAGTEVQMEMPRAAA
ncbi:signal transduction histidine kinase [Saccharopolyspora phatthalungensis]|uniref:Signal transduction histidine kinase n=2 Tax=Saccharopolyspora phatthalungensis TaxID=664693 RepID=A0A840Q4M4_9PSEU|nr:ATP-binding protein [Saccharopolyspora phatthalungensis]MBB5154850.1 signal transduction histidine kinase [Saccharopolyspora phatthalungensis]